LSKPLKYYKIHHSITTKQGIKGYSLAINGNGNVVRWENYGGVLSSLMQSKKTGEASTLARAGATIGRPDVVVVG
jgi:hypothetical protein